MSAYVEFKFKRGFILDEERLRNIHNIIQSRKHTNFEPKPIYTIYRSDNYEYTTDNIEDILKEDNNELNKIIKLRIESKESVEKGQVFSFSIEFDAKQELTYKKIQSNETLLEVKGEDRDFVFLFYSDLKKYLMSEVNNKRIVRLDSLGVVRFLPLLLISLLPIFLLYNLPYDAVERTNALNSQDIMIKLNYLIDKNNDFTNFPKYSKYMLILPFLVMLSLTEGFEIFFNKMISQYLFPSNLFLFGKECIRHKKILDLRSKIIWVIIVGLLISIIASLIVWKITVNS